MSKGFYIITQQLMLDFIIENDGAPILLKKGKNHKFYNLL